jgi:SAM domain (Sterile alpha motif)
MDIGGWLRGLGLERYEAVFRENEIDETVLPNLTAEDLKELGVGALGHRRTARLEEVRGEQSWPVGTRAIAARANVTVETLIDDSEKVFQRAMEINQLSAANTAIKGKGILTGKWVERAEVGSPGEYDALSDDDLERQIMERMARLGYVVTLAIPHMDNDVDSGGRE